MTVASTNNKIIYTGDGSTTVFPYNFKIFDEDDLEVTLVTIATGAETLLTITTHYTVSGVGNEAGGNVTTVATYSSAYKLVIKRVPARTQTLDYQENDDFPSEATEDVMDKLTHIDQDQDEQLGRCIKLPITTSITNLTFPDGSANKIVGWNADGDELENKTPADISSAFDITLGASDADKLVKVNSSGNGYEVEKINDQTDATITASDEILFGDVNDSNNLKKDTVQGILDLVTGFESSDITGQTEAVIGTDDYIVYSDTGDSGNLKKDTVQGILDLVSGTNAQQLAKAWISFNGTGTIAINDSFNVSSIVDSGTGDYDIVFDTDFTNANYCPVGATGGNTLLLIVTKTVGQVRILTRNTSGTGIDVDEINLAFFGDQ